MKKYRLDYRQRVFFCEKCDLRIEHLGEHLDGAKCPCCKVHLRKLKVELDQDISVKKTVSAHKSHE